jgi:outer membrane protein
VQVKSSELRVAGVRAEAEHGGRTILDVLDADLEVRDAQIALITAKRNQVVAEYALASSLGLLLPGAPLGIMENVFDPDAFLQKTKSKILSTAAGLEQETE